MPRFEPDFENTSVLTPIYKRGEYELEIKTIKPFGYHAEARDGKQERDVAGVTIFFKMVGPIDSKGKVGDAHRGDDVTPHKLYLHTEGSYKNTLLFLMAALGYAKKEEPTFKAEWLAKNKGEVWVDGQDEDVTCGTAYKQVEGRRVRASLDVREYQGEEQQDFKNFFPAK